MNSKTRPTAMSPCRVSEDDGDAAGEYCGSETSSGLVISATSRLECCEEETARERDVGGPRYVHLRILLLDRAIVSIRTRLWQARTISPDRRFRGDKCTCNNNQAAPPVNTSCTCDDGQHALSEDVDGRLCTSNHVSISPEFRSTASCHDAGSLCSRVDMICGSVLALE